MNQYVSKAYLCEVVDKLQKRINDLENRLDRIEKPEPKKEEKKNFVDWDVVEENFSGHPGFFF